MERVVMASWMIRGRSLRSGRSIRSRHDSEDDVQLDMSKDASECAREILTNICKKQGLTDGKRFGYLNAFVKLLTKTDIGSGDLGYTIEDIQCCLRVAMVHESSLVRAATLRALRYLLKEERDVKTLIRLQYPHLIARSLDINLRNDMERMQALRLMRRMLLMHPANFPAGLVRCLVAMVIGGPEEKDRMLRAALAILAETCVLNPDVFVACGGVSAVTHSILDAQMPRIVECLCGALLFLLNHPRTRARAGVRLQSLAAPYCDFHWGGAEKEAREQRLLCCRLALLSVLRSWPGVLHFCHPDNTSGLQAIISVLYLRQVEVRKGILDLVTDLLCLPQSEWTDEYAVALDAIDPSRPKDSWRLSEGFIAAEGKDVLPNLAKFTPNIVEIHQAVLLYTLLEAGLFEALVEVSASSDNFVSVRATILLGELLQMTHRLLPPECCNLSPPLPGLLVRAANERDLAGQHQALAAVSALSRLHQLHKRRPAPSSLFLDLVLQGGSWSRSSVAAASSSAATLGPGESGKARSKVPQFIVKEGSDDVLKESGVLTNKDGFSWNWNLVRAVLKSRSDAFKKLEDSNYRLFLKRLVNYFKPSSNRFSRVELGNKRQTQMYTLACSELVDCLLDVEEVEGGKLLAELLGDISVQIDAILTSKSAHDCFFSPQHVTNSVCQDYFLLIGRLCRTPRGSRALDKAGIFQQLMNLVVSTNHDCYMKLVISGLDYSTDGMPRVILSKLLTVPSESSRLYATQYLLVLMRAKLPDFHKWGVELLVNQLYDKSKAVSLAALTILGEATHDKIYLDALIALRPSLLHLGDRGLLLLIRFLSTPAGFTFLQDANFVTNELERWNTNFNYRYVRLVEGEIHDSFTLHQRGEDGRYSRRVTSAKHIVHDVFIPPHLYGQLVQHDKGFQLLLKEGRLDHQFQVVSAQRCGSEQEILELKAAMWSCGHVGSTPAGVALLTEDGIVSAVVRLAESCPVYSVRATALYVLGLLATTRQGADELQRLGWLCVRHNRHDRWPVIEDESLAEDAEGREESSVGAETDNLSLSSGTESDCKLTVQPPHEGRRFYISDEAESLGSADDEGLLLDELSESAQSVDVPGRKSSLPHQRKSQTLPHARQGRGLTAPRHIRSLSESKQPHLAPSLSPGQHSIDWQPVSRLKESAVYSPGGLVASRAEETKSRSNSCTDSSGVSSCDSTVGKHATMERVKTLSPIPSSTSLNTLRSPAPDVMDKLRKLSLQSCSLSEGLVGAPDVMSSRLSQQDLLGYATLRSLHQHRRPLFSDTSSLAAVELLGFDDHGLAAVSAARANKIRSLDRQYTNPVTCEFEATNPPQLFGGASSAGLVAKTYVGSRTNIFGRLSVVGSSGQNCYMGIALPRRLSSLFPSEKAGATVVSADERKRSDKGPSFSEMEQVQEVVEEGKETTSSDTEDTDEGRKGQEGVSAGRYKHTAVHCLVCCRLRDRKISVGSYHRYRTDTDSSYGGTDSPVVTLKRRKSYSVCNGLLGIASTGSVDSSNSLDAGQVLVEEEGTLLSKSLARKQILRHVSRMSNPVWGKQSKQALLQLKQKYPSAFQDVCLYSEVCHRMASCTYRLVARRFIQELFLDLTFDSLFDEPVSILQLQKSLDTPAVATATTAPPSTHTSCMVTFLPTLCVTSSPPVVPSVPNPPHAESQQALEVVREEVLSASGGALGRTCCEEGTGETAMAARFPYKLATIPTDAVLSVTSSMTVHLGYAAINNSVLVTGNVEGVGSHISHSSKPKIVSYQSLTGIENLSSIMYADEAESEFDGTLSPTRSPQFGYKPKVFENDVKVVNCATAGDLDPRTSSERPFETVSMENNVPIGLASCGDPGVSSSDTSGSKATSSRHLPAKGTSACARQRKLATALPPNISTLARTLSHPVPVLTGMSKTEENRRHKSSDGLLPLSGATVGDCKKL